MPIAVACPKCQKKYNLPDRMMGRPVKCPACGVQFQIPARGGARQQMDPKQLAAQQKARAEAQQRAVELQKMGVDGVIQRTPDVFDATGGMQGTADPLGNHMIEDPGFADVSYTHTESADINESADPMAGMFENPAIEKKKKSNKVAKPKKKKRGKVKWYSQPWFFLLVVFIPLFAISIALMYWEIVDAETARIIAYINVGIFGLINAMVGFWGLSLVAEEGDDLQVLLCRFVPGYLIFFVATHWNSMKDFAYATIVGILLTPVGVVVLAFADVWMFASEV